MYKIKKLTLSVLAVFILLSAFGIAWAADTGFDKWRIETINDVNKVWSIRFNMPLDEASVNNKNIYIESDTGNVDIKLTTSKDGYIVYAAPIKAFEMGKDYKLYITKGVKGKKGNPLKTPIIVPFTVVDESAKIQYISHNYSEFLTMFTIVASPDVHRVTINSSSYEMHYQGNNVYTYAIPDLKKGSTVTIRAYDENNKRIEIKRYKIE